MDLSDPKAPSRVTYATNRKFPRAANGALLTCSDVNDCGDLGPEGLTFVPAAESPKQELGYLSTAGRPCPAREAL